MSPHARTGALPGKDECEKKRSASPTSRTINTNRSGAGALIRTAFYREHEMAAPISPPNPTPAKQTTGAPPASVCRPYTSTSTGAPRRPLERRLGAARASKDSTTWVAKRETPAERERTLRQRPGGYPVRSSACPRASLRSSRGSDSVSRPHDDDLGSLPSPRRGAASEFGASYSGTSVAAVNSNTRRSGFRCHVTEPNTSAIALRRLTGQRTSQTAAT